MDELRRRVMAGGSDDTPLPPGTILNFEFTGAVQSTKLPPGTYKLECWGAEGGARSGRGGRGGYSVGTLTLSNTTTIYVYVGREGSGAAAQQISDGGFNGGGDGWCTTTKYLQGGGGGASDIRIGTDSLYARVIVAGGGGGKGMYNSTGYVGGYGGGLTGGTPSDYQSGFNPGHGGTQTSGGARGSTVGSSGSFGQGGGYDPTNIKQTAGGGGGWYGGGSAIAAPAGGGSGYVYTAETASNYPSGCLLNSSYYLSDAETIAGDQTFPSNPNGTSFRGHVRITVVAPKTSLDDSEFGFSASSITVTDSSDTLPTLYNTHGLSVTYSSTDTSVATIAADGTVTFLNDGSTIIKATFAGNDYYYPKEVSYTLTVDLHFEPVITNYSYTGSVQSTTLSAGTYILECWGAVGGGASGSGGKGGYSVGTLTLPATTNVYIYVGGAGTYNSAVGEYHGGFNGGGNCYTFSSKYKESSGGGASDIRIGADSLYARVIVAGGGGGAGMYNNTGYAGGAGGGLQGITPSRYESGYNPGGGGGQTSGGSNGSGSAQRGSFGQGGGMNPNYTKQTAGGGGGWYGGGSAIAAPGGGGSGYVYTSSTANHYPSGCLLNSNYYLSDAETIDGDHSFPAPAGGTETGHQDNGYIRITQIA